MKDKKYIVLDFGNVLAGPLLENWFITPNFWHIFNKEDFSLDVFEEAIRIYNPIISRKFMTTKEEYKCFLEFYKCIFLYMKLECTDMTSKIIANDWTYNMTKFKFFDGIENELIYLSQRYKFLMLTDNWPSVIKILKDRGLYKYFEKIYISSKYGCLKREGIFFDYMLRDYPKLKNCLFVDDNADNLDKAKEKALIPIMMNRYDSNQNNKYKTINSLYEL